MHINPLRRSSCEGIYRYFGAKPVLCCSWLNAGVVLVKPAGRSAASSRDGQVSFILKASLEYMPLLILINQILYVFFCLFV